MLERALDAILVHCHSRAPDQRPEVAVSFFDLVSSHFVTDCLSPAPHTHENSLKMRLQKPGPQDEFSHRFDADGLLEQVVTADELAGSRMRAKEALARLDLCRQIRHAEAPDTRWTTDNCARIVVRHCNAPASRLLLVEMASHLRDDHDLKSLGLPGHPSAKVKDAPPLRTSVRVVLICGSTCPQSVLPWARSLSSLRACLDSAAKGGAFMPVRDAKLTQAPTPDRTNQTLTIDG